MDIHQILNLSAAVLAAAWVAVGPLATSAITAWINHVVGSYVPRPVQIILSSVLTAVTAGLTGPLAGMDPATSIGIGLAAGAGSQGFAQIHPKTLLTSAPEPVMPTPPVTPPIAPVPSAPLVPPTPTD